jgi:hypothetical protein
VPRFEGRQALAVEAGDEVGDGVAALAADRPGGDLIIDPVADQEESGGAGRLGCGGR